MALAPLLTLADADAAADARALDGVAHWLLRFSPAVAVDAPDGVFLDIAGCAHLWGGEARLAAALAQRLAAQDIPARIAVADTFSAAWALAHHAPDIITASQDAAALASLPVAALRLDDSVAAALRHLGLKTIGRVMATPREALRKRFGAGLLLQLDRVLGRAEETPAFLHPPAPWMARRVFAEPISRPEDFTRLLADLAHKLCARLDRAGLGARGFEAVFYRVDGASAGRAVETALPMRDAKRLSELFAAKLETLDPGFGVEIVTLEARAPAPLATAQADLVEAAADARSADLAPLIDRLRNRLGPERVWRAEPFASHAPERAVARRAPLTPARGAAWPADRPRPIRLFAHPQPVEAFAVAPDDPPFVFRWRGRAHRVARAEGPERIGAEWWRKPWVDNAIDRVRDYYCVEDEAGARFWIFRSGLYGGETPVRWFLHGLFA